MEEICKSEERKLRLESIMSLVYKESKQESLDVNTLKQVLFNVESNIEIYGEIEEYLHKLPMIFHTFVYGDKEYVKLTLVIRDVISPMIRHKEYQDISICFVITCLYAKVKVSMEEFIIG